MLFFFQMINLCWTECTLKGHWKRGTWATSVLFPLWKGGGPSFVPSLVEIGSVFLEVKSWQTVRQTDRWTTGNQKNSLDLQLRWAKNRLREHLISMCYFSQNLSIFTVSITQYFPQICCQLIIANLATIIRCYQLPVDLCWIKHSLSLLSVSLSLSSFFINVAVMFFYVQRKYKKYQ